jgi:dephospho-CoA kinase
MLKVGITGGIGSGKSTVCGILESLGIPVYYADSRSKLLYYKPAIREKVEALLGPESYLEDSEPDKGFIADKVFNDKSLLKALESILHPAVAIDFAEWVKSMPADVPYVGKEAALLFESGSYKALDIIVVVLAPMELRRQRVTRRDNHTEEEFMARLEKQWTDEQRLQLANHIIYNDEKQLLIPQVLELHGKLRKLAEAEGETA